MHPELDDFKLGDWHVDVGGNRLQRGGEARPLRHKAMALLVLLARHAGQTVPREIIVAEVWDGNRFVAEKAINTAIWAIRQALGDDPDSPRYIQTVAKKGYRLIAPVGRPSAAPQTPSPAAEPAGAPTPVRHAPSTPPAPAQRPMATARLLPRRATVVCVGLLLTVLSTLAWLALRSPAAGTSAVPVAAPLTQLPGLEYVGRLSPDGQWVAFGWWQGRGGGRLHVRRATEAEAAPRDLSGERGDVEALAWSPDGLTIAFTATEPPGRCTLWRVGVDGSGARALAPCAPVFTPSLDWSPDGRTLVFSGEADGAGGLFAISPDGTGLHRLTTSAPRAMPDHQPAFSPDGRRLVFARQDPGNGTRDIYELDETGTPARVTSMKFYRLHGLTWSGDGRELVYSTTQQDRRVLMRWDFVARRAWPLGLEGSAPARALDGRVVYALLRAHVSISRLAPGAAVPERTIHSIGSDREPHDTASAPGPVFVSRRGDAPELWLAGRQGQAPRALTHLAGTVAAPAWSPDGQHIAFIGSCGPDGRIGLCRLDLADARVRPLATDAAEYGRPAWHPDGQSVWVTSDRGGRWQVWRVDASRGDVQPVPTDLVPGRALDWTADGHELVYESADGRHLRWRPSAGGPEQERVSPGDASLVDWRLGHGRLWWLLRSARERIERVDLATGQLDVLADLPLGSFPERARLAVAAEGGLWVEAADNSTADLMLAR